MPYTCALCGEKIDGELEDFIAHNEDHIVDEIKKKHPEWIEGQGACPRCIEYFRQQMKGDS